MLQEVCVGTQSLENYRSIVGDDVIEELRDLGESLKGARVAHINATAYGGGVAELLRSIVPLYRDLGIHADWNVIRGDDSFFNVTKRMHNTLQGADYRLTPKDQDTFLAYSSLNAQLMEKEYDYYFVHDPQPAALRHLRSDLGGKWVWRCHIDTSAPNPATWSFLSTFIDQYDALVFTMREFAPPGVGRHAVFMPPGIDPLSPKNRDLPMDICWQIVDWIGIALDRPFILQVSRFDPWKDPHGVIQVYRLVREQVPGLQVVLLGSMAQDDPEAWDIYQSIIEEAKGDSNIHVYTNLTGVGNLEVNAFQRLASVALQKSIREGFGLVVAETLWKGTPIITTHTGGIPMQIPANCEQYMVENSYEAAGQMMELIQDRDTALAYGWAGREHVRNNFMITRLLRDELQLLRSLK